jgi:hypothetical protein
LEKEWEAKLGSGSGSLRLALLSLMEGYWIGFAKSQIISVDRKPSFEAMGLPASGQHLPLTPQPECPQSEPLPL